MNDIEALFDPNPILGPVKNPNVTANLKPFSALYRGHFHGVHLAIVGVKNGAFARPHMVAFFAFSGQVANDFHADDFLVFAVIGAQIAHRFGLGVFLQCTANDTTEYTVVFGDAYLAFRLFGFVVYGVPHTDRCHLGAGGKATRQGQHGE